MDRVCEICGSNNFVQKYTENDMLLCAKHRSQMRLYGKILERTKFDKNEIDIKDDHAEIVIYDKYNNEKARALIDIEDVDKVSDYKWGLRKRYVYCCYRDVNLHELILGKMDGMFIDHINRDRLDNRKCNLRFATKQQNNMNKTMRSDNMSGMTGIWFDKERKKWCAEVRLNGKKVYFTRHKTKEDAIQARIDAELRIFGEFAPSLVDMKQEVNNIEDTNNRR